MFRRSLVVAALAVGALVPVSAPAQAAGPVCNQGSTLCVTAVTYGAPTLSNANEVSTTVRVTLTAASSQPACLAPAWELPWSGGAPDLTPVAGNPGVYEGRTPVVPAGTAPGSYYPALLACEGNHNEVPRAALAAAGLGGLTITGTADRTPPRIEAMSVGPTTVDATLKDVTVPVSLSLADDVAGVFGPIELTATPASVPADLAQSLASEPRVVHLQRTAGTDRRGVWSGSVVLPGGSGTSWRLSFPLYDLVYNGSEQTTAALAAAGRPSQVTTRTTAAPPAPAGVKATSNVSIDGTHYVDFKGPAQAAGKPMATTWLVTSTSAQCPANFYRMPGYARVSGGRRSGFTYCTFTLRAANAAGRSAPVTLSAFL